MATERRRWRVRQRHMDPSRPVFLDEAGASTNLARRYSWSPRGERLTDAAPHGHWRTTTFVAGLCKAGARTRDALWNTIGRLLDKFSHNECRNYRVWCGRSGSNRHSGSQKRILSPPRLPVPPRPRCRRPAGAAAFPRCPAVYCPTWQPSMRRAPAGTRRGPGQRPFENAGGGRPAGNVSSLPGGRRSR